MKNLLQGFLSFYKDAVGPFSMHNDNVIQRKKTTEMKKHFFDCTFFSRPQMKEGNAPTLSRLFPWRGSPRSTGHPGGLCPSKTRTRYITIYSIRLSIFVVGFTFTTYMYDEIIFLNWIILCRTCNSRLWYCFRYTICFMQI